jgi:hypothetical protein
MLILQREIKWDGKSKAHEQIKKNPFMAEQNGYDPVTAEMDVEDLGKYCSSIGMGKRKKMHDVVT